MTNPKCTSAFELAVKINVDQHHHPLLNTDFRKLDSLPNWGTDFIKPMLVTSRLYLKSSYCSRYPQSLHLSMLNVNLP